MRQNRDSMNGGTMNSLKLVALLLLMLSQVLLGEHSCLVTLEDLDEENPIAQAKKIQAENRNLMVGSGEYETFFSSRSLRIELKVLTNGFDKQKDHAHPFSDFEGNIKINSKVYHINLFRLTRTSSKIVSIPESNMRLNFRCHDETFKGNKHKNYLDFIGEYTPLKNSKHCSSLYLNAESTEEDVVNFTFTQKGHKAKKYTLTFNRPNSAIDDGDKLIYKITNSENKMSWEKYKKRNSNSKVELVEKNVFELRNLLLMNKKYHKDVLVHIRENRKGKVRKCYFQRY